MRLPMLLAATLASAPGCQLVIDVNQIVLADAGTSAEADGGRPTSDAGDGPPDGGGPAGDAGPGDGGPACAPLDICTIGGVAYCVGAIDPANVCRRCEPGSNPGGWSAASLGSPCDGDESECTKDECDGSGQCAHPAVTDGQSCRGGGGSCAAGKCEGGCAAGETACGAQCCQGSSQRCSAGACVPACSVLEQDCLGPSGACYPSGAGAACQEAGSGGDGAACAAHPGCAEGLGCFPAAWGGSACQPFCEPSAPSACSAPRICARQGPAGFGLCQCAAGEAWTGTECQCKASPDSCAAADATLACDGMRSQCESASESCGSTLVALELGTPLQSDLFGAHDDLAGSCGGAGLADRVFELTLAADATVDFQVIRQGADTGFEPRLYVRRTCADSTELACASAGAAAKLTATADLEAGKSYVVVDGGDGARHPFTLTASARVRPPNDGCANPAVLSLGSGNAATASGDTSDASDDGAGSCGGAGSRDLVYQLSSSSQTALRATVTVDPSTPFNPVVYLRSTCADPSLQAETGCWQGTSGVAVVETAGLLTGSTYWLLVDGEGGAGDFGLEVHLFTPLPQDTCAGAVALAKGSFSAGDTIFALNDYGAGTSCPPTPLPGSDVVYKYTPTTSGSFTVTVSPGGLWNPAVSVMTGACGDAGTCAGHADMAGAAGKEELSVSGTAGTAYYILVDSAERTGRGLFSIEIE